MCKTDKYLINILLFLGVPLKIATSLPAVKKTLRTSQRVISSTKELNLYHFGQIRSYCSCSCWFSDCLGISPLDTSELPSEIHILSLTLGLKTLCSCNLFMNSFLRYRRTYLMEWLFHEKPERFDFSMCVLFWHFGRPLAPVMEFMCFHVFNGF